MVVVLKYRNSGAHAQLMFMQFDPYLFAAILVRSHMESKFRYTVDMFLDSCPSQTIQASAAHVAAGTNNLLSMAGVKAGDDMPVGAGVVCWASYGRMLIGSL